MYIFLKYKSLAFDSGIKILELKQKLSCKEIDNAISGISLYLRKIREALRDVKKLQDNLDIDRVFIYINSLIYVINIKMN